MDKEYEKWNNSQDDLLIKLNKTMKTKELKLTQKELEKLILLMEDKYWNKMMFYQTKVLYHKLLNLAK